VGAAHPQEVAALDMVELDCVRLPHHATLQAHRLVYHSTLGLRVIKKKKKNSSVFPMVVTSSS